MPLGLILIGKHFTVFSLEIGHNPIDNFLMLILTTLSNSFENQCEYFYVVETY